MLEDWELKLNKHEICLRGYCVYGQGTEVSYWWLDEHNDVVLMSKHSRPMAENLYD